MITDNSHGYKSDVESTLGLLIASLLLYVQFVLSHSLAFTLLLDVMENVNLLPVSSR